jgi:hypothetical protein
MFHRGRYRDVRALVQRNVVYKVGMHCVGVSALALVVGIKRMVYDAFAEYLAVVRGHWHCTMRGRRGAQELLQPLRLPLRN